MNEHLKSRSRNVWGATPAGQIYDQAGTPGTTEFFDAVRRIRDGHEQPWLERLLSFRSTRGRAVLELGCGAGFDAYKFCASGARYTGIDLAPENVARTLAHLAPHGFSPRVLEADAERLPFADAGFDLVYSNGVLHHTPDMPQALTEAYRVLRPGGQFWMLVYHRMSVFYWLTLYLEHYLLRGDFRRYRSFADRLAKVEYTTADVAPIVNAYTRRELRAHLESVGFETPRFWIRKLNREDLPTLPVIRRLWPHVPQRVLDRIGRRFGWYVIAHARKPG